MHQTKHTNYVLCIEAAVESKNQPNETIIHRLYYNRKCKPKYQFPSFMHQIKQTKQGSPSENSPTAKKPTERNNHLVYNRKCKT